jgi:NADH dehydrogenase
VPSENKIILHNGEMSYDHLVFATGAETSYFGGNVKKKRYSNENAQ